MVITVASYKGGVGKSTTAVHLAAYLQQQAPTVLIDGDPNRSVCGWALNGNLPFNVIHLHQAARLARNYEHAIIDTNARPEPEEISELVQGCDLLIIPTTPDALSLQALQMTTNAIEKAKGNNYKVLLTIIPPKPNRDGKEMRSELTGREFPCLRPVFGASLPIKRQRLPAFPSTMPMTAGLKTPGETTSTSERRFSLEYPLRKGPGEPWQASALY